MFSLTWAAGFNYMRLVCKNYGQPVAKQNKKVTVHHRDRRDHRA